MALDNKTIISLQDAKVFVSIASTESSYDQLLDMLIQHASAAVAKELGVDGVVSDTYKEFRDGHSGCNLWTNNYPIINVNLISVGRDDALTIAYGNEDASYATAEVTATELRLRKRVSGTLTASTFTLADYATLALLETAVELVSGWTVIVNTDFTTYPASSLIPVPAKDARDNAVTLSVPDEGEQLCEVDYRWGKLYNPYGWSTRYNPYGRGAMYDPYGRGEWPRGIYIEYTAGYPRESIPQPIKAACLMALKSAYDSSSTDSSIAEEKIGDYSYKLAETSGVSNIIQSPAVQEMLGPYKRQTVFGI